MKSNILKEWGHTLECITRVFGLRVYSHQVQNNFKGEVVSLKLDFSAPVKADSLFLNSPQPTIFNTTN